MIQSDRVFLPNSLWGPYLFHGWVWLGLQRGSLVSLPKDGMQERHIRELGRKFHASDWKEKLQQEEVFIMFWLTQHSQDFSCSVHGWELGTGALKGANIGRPESRMWGSTAGTRGAREQSQCNLSL